MTSLFEVVTDFLIPPRCVMCGIGVGKAGLVCAQCFQELEFITEPFCKVCARPFVSKSESGQSSVCLECSGNAPNSWGECRASFVYNEGFKKLILPLKYGDTQKAVNLLSKLMCHSARNLLNRADYIIPVPLHIKRLRSRKYNQAALLARHIGKLSNIPVLPMGLYRTKETPGSGHLNKLERQNLVSDAFIFNLRYRDRLSQKKILLIDDVMTTGATLKACTSTLLKYNVFSVDVLVAGRVL